MRRAADHSAQAADHTAERVRFLSRLELFRGLDRDELERVARSIEERKVRAGEAILVEGGRPGTGLWVVRRGTLELVHNEVVVALVTAGDVVGHPTLLSGREPVFTARARRDASLYRIPKKVAVDVLSRPEGVRFVARTDRERLIEATRAMRSVPDVRTRPVTALLRDRPVFSEAGTSIREVAALMAAERLSAVLVRTRRGLGIVTDVDLRDKVVTEGVSRDAPIETIMTRPVRTVKANLLAPEASVEMMAAGVNHLPVVDDAGRIVGILSASSLLDLDALSPFALRRSIHSAHDEHALEAVAADVPKLILDLFDAHVEPAALARILTVLNDAMTSRLLEIAFERRGRPPAAYAWLAFGSTARSELTLASDQDNGLAYADGGAPEVDEYFRLVCEDVNAGLRSCGFSLDPHGVVARNPRWRRSQSQWVELFSRCLRGYDDEDLIRAAITFDFRHVAGDLAIVPPLTGIICEAPQHRRFLAGLAELGSEVPSPLRGFRQRLQGPIDIKAGGLLPIQNLARYYAFAQGITAQTTTERLVAVQHTGAEGARSAQRLLEAHATMSHVQWRHHADAVRAGRAPDNDIDAGLLRPLDRAALQEALRVVVLEQRRLPLHAALL